MAERMNRADLRELLLATGVDLVVAGGLRVSADTVSFPAVFAEVERRTGRRVSRGSVYERIWISLENFHWDVISRITEHAGGAQMVETARRLGDALEAIAPAGATLSDADRWQAVDVIAATVVAPHVTDAMERVELRIVRGTIPAITADDDDLWDEGINARATLARFIDHEAAWLAALATVAGRQLGLRLREDVTLDDLATALGALLDGVITRSNVTGRYRGTGPAGTPDAEVDEARATPLVTALRMLVRGATELDPDWTGPLDAATLRRRLQEATLGGSDPAEGGATPESDDPGS